MNDCLFICIKKIDLYIVKYDLLNVSYVLSYMDQQILLNTETIINNFNELLIKTINSEKNKLIEDLKSQIKTEVVQKLNGTQNQIFKDEKITFSTIIKEVITYFQKYNKSNQNLIEYINNQLDDISDINLKPDEFIINYKYQSISGHVNSSINDIHLYFIFLTNYGTFVIKRLHYKKLVYTGKYKLPDETLYIINEFFNIILEKNTNDNTYIYDGYNDLLIVNMTKMINIIEKIQSDYYLKPLVGHHAEQLINENKKLKEENEKVKLLHDQVIQEKENIKQLQEKLDNDMKIYNDIKNMERKWNQIKEYKTKLDILFEKIKKDREEFEKQKKNFEDEKMQFEKIRVEFDINNSQLDEDFVNFIKNDQNIDDIDQSTKVTKNDPISLYEKIKQNPLILKDIDDNQKTESLCIIALDENISALEYVPTHMLNDIYKYLLTKKYNILDKVPEHLITEQFANMAIEIDINNIKSIPHRFITDEICNIIIDEIETENNDFCCHETTLNYIPKRYKPHNFCRDVVLKNVCELDYIPEELQTIEFYKLAIINDPHSFLHIPLEKRFDLVTYLIDNNFTNILTENMIPKIIKCIKYEISNIIKNKSLYPEIDIDKATDAIKILLWKNTVMKFSCKPVIDLVIELCKQVNTEVIKGLTKDILLI